MLEILQYLSPTMIAELLLQYLPRQQVKILDIGCGTGLTSKLLHSRGYQNLDGLDFSADMLRVADNRGIYRDLFEADLNQPLDIADGYYDAAISSGTFTHGHVGPEPLDEVFRILKNNGIFACTIHLDLWRSRGFASKLQDMIDQALIRCLYREQGCFYKDGEPEGWFCIYQKLSTK